MKNLACEHECDRTILSDTQWSPSCASASWARCRRSRETEIRLAHALRAPDAKTAWTHAG
jgi:hypothetical protein